MKKVIKGHLYDTEKAKTLGTWSTDYSDNLRWMEEILFRTKSGMYFLFGSGGPATKYCERIDSNSWRSGERIIPLTPQEALEWAEKHLDGGEVEQIFGPIEDNTILLAIRTTQKTIDKFNRIKKEKGMTAGAFLEELLENWE